MGEMQLPNYTYTFATPQVSYLVFPHLRVSMKVAFFPEIILLLNFKSS